MKTIIIGIMSLIFFNQNTHAANESSQELFFVIRLSQSDVSTGLRTYRQFHSELEKNGFGVISETLRSTTRIAVFRKEKGQAIDRSLVVNQLRGCAEFNDSCIDLIYGLNRNYQWRELDFAGLVELPETAFWYDIRVKVDDRKQMLFDIIEKFKPYILMPVGDPSYSNR